MVKPEHLMAVKNTYGVDVEFLGSLLWFSITDSRITREDLRRAFTDAGIDLSYLPRPICARDAFRRATKQAALRRHPLPDDKYLNLLCREVRQDDKEIVYHVVREVVDSKNVRLEYLPVTSLALREENVDMYPLHPLNTVEHDRVNAVLEEFSVAKENYDGKNIRELVLAILRGACKPVAVRPSGGVYFTPQNYQETVEALKGLVARVAEFGVTASKSCLWTVPVINAHEQKAMIEQSLEEQVAGESKSLIEEMTEIIKSGRKITDRLAQRFVERTRGLGKLVKEYEDLLQTEVVTARANYDLALTEALALLAKVDVGNAA